MALEKSISGSIISYIRQIGGQAEKVKGDSSASGRPDINACYQGRCIRIEAKTPDHRNTASKKQKISLKRWGYAGAVCMTVYSKKSFMYFMTCLFCGETGHLAYADDNGCISHCYIPEIKRSSRR